VENGQIVATYRAPDLVIAPGSMSVAFVKVFSVTPAGSVQSALGSADMRLYAQNTAVVSVSPERLFASAVNTAAVTIGGLCDVEGNPVPDGTKCLVLASTHQTNFSYSTSAGVIEGGAASGPYGSLVQECLVSNGQISVTYRAPDLAITAGQHVPRYIQVWSCQTNGTYLSRLGVSPVDLVGLNSAVVVASPDRLYADSRNTAAVVIGNIKDVAGTPVPDGTKCLVLASATETGLNYATSAGVIEGGASSGYGSLVRELTKPPFSEAEGMRMALEDWNRPEQRSGIKAWWSAEAKKRYLSIAEKE